MPLIYFNCPENIFSQETKDKMANELTDIALRIEKLPDTNFVKSTCWIYFKEYPKENIYHGGANTGTNVISLEVNAFKGGLYKAQKKEFISKFTSIIHTYLSLDENALTPVYIIFRDIATRDWGVFGNTIKLSDLHHPPVDAEPI